MERYATSRPPAELGFFAGLSGIGKNAVSLLINRFELAALEATVVGANLAKLAALGALAVLGTWFAIAYWSVLIVALAWDAMGAWILFIMALLFTGLVAGLLMAARSIIQGGKLSLPATMAELRNDRDALFGKDPSQEQSPT